VPKEGYWLVVQVQTSNQYSTKKLKLVLNSGLLKNIISRQLFSLYLSNTPHLTWDKMLSIEFREFL
jgi:hypothetical protein